MIMNLKYQKRLAADLMKCGVNRVKIKQSEEVEEALAREDIRELIDEGLIWKAPKKGQRKTEAKKRKKQKKKGRRKGPGSRKGKKGSRYRSKEGWMKKVRSLRKLLKDLRDNEQITRREYQDLYQKVKGNMFRNRKHLLYHLKETGKLKQAKVPRNKAGGK